MSATTPLSTTPPSIAERYGWRDPRCSAWTPGDLAYGTGVAALALIGSLLVACAIALGPAVQVGGVTGALVGLPTLVVVGIPVACGALTAGLARALAKRRATRMRGDAA